MSSKTNRPNFNELQSEWYQKLADEKFPEIEDVRHPDRPLKDWHSFGFISSRSQIRQHLRQEYQERVELFYHRPDLDDICRILVNHGNTKVNARQAKVILELHVEGLTERKIAKKMRRSKTCIHGILERLRAWMKIT